MRNLVAVLVAMLWAGSCSKSLSDGGGASDLSPAAKARLADYCGKRDVCQAELGLTDVDACPTSMCLASMTEERPLLEFFDCQLARPCSSFFNDDECFAASGAPNAERDAFLARCTARGVCGAKIAEACPIVAMPIVDVGWLRMFDACLALPCPDLEVCWDAVNAMACW
jgi:hypothetical protein